MVETLKKDREARRKELTRPREYETIHTGDSNAVCKPKGTINGTDHNCR